MDGHDKLSENSSFEGRYVLKKKLWNDKSRTYWLAYDETLEREVVLFIMLLTASDVHDTRTNMVMMAGLQHPHIIPIYDLRETDTYLYAVQFYAQKQSIMEHLDKIKPNQLNTQDILRLAQQLASAIDYIHKYNIIHYHIRPEVVLLDNNLNLYLTELYVPRNKKQLSSKYGIVEYAAPEQFGDNDLNSSCDIYGFGIILFELFVQQYPFPRNNDKPYLASLGWKQLNEDSDIKIPSVCQFRPDLPISIDLVLQRLCAKNPEERYLTATEAVDDMYKAFYSRQSNIEGKIFISYARKDSEYVHKLADELRRIGLDIWIDRDIEAGSNWDDAIETALNDCDLMLLITTDASMASEYVTHEWSYFMGSKKPVYPFIPQNPAPDNIHPRLQRVQHVVGTDDMLNNVARIIEMLSSKVSTPANE
ncbi:MAG: TIR domain-containing protein [Phototrophicaceae bacterium]